MFKKIGLWLLFQGQIVPQVDLILDSFEWSMESTIENKTMSKNWQALNDT